MSQHRIILFVGKRNTGKSVLMNDIMYHLSKKVDFGIAMTPTEETAQAFRAHMPDQCIYSGFDSAKVDAMLRIQRELCKQHKARSLFIALDDCMYDKKVLKGLSMRDLFMNGRHLHITLLNAMQYVMDMGPDLRTQVDYVFALRENIIANKHKLWKFFFGMFETYAEFNRVMEKCTENYSCLVLDNTSRSNDISDCVFWYRADIDIPDFKMGSDVYWRMATRSQPTEEERCQAEIERLNDEAEEKRVEEKHKITLVTKKDEISRPAE
eukprot:6180082-Pleurochrysis_carterae.AAC.4